MDAAPRRAAFSARRGQGLPAMRFARRVLLQAEIQGILAFLPQGFLEDGIATENPQEER
jgi:hypothetical protein